ncbi:MAG: hypothetical protein WKF31_04740 [Thermoleophilaceae bacterium]
MTCCHVAPARTRTAWLDSLCASGELVWVGAGALGRSSGRVALFFREDARWLGPPPSKGEPPSTPLHRGAARAALGRCVLLHRPAGGRDLDRGRDAVVEPVEIQEALWDLVWAGEATNDAWAPLRAPACRSPAPRPSARGASRDVVGPAAPQTQGRWSLTGPLFADAPGRRPAASRPGRAAARALRDRHPRDSAGRGHPRRLQRRCTRSS